MRHDDIDIKPKTMKRVLRLELHVRIYTDAGSLENNESGYPPSYGSEDEVCGLW